MLACLLAVSYSFNLLLIQKKKDEAQTVPILSKTIPIWRHIKGKEKGKGWKQISSKEMGEKGIVLLKNGTDWASSKVLSTSIFYSLVSPP